MTACTELTNPQDGCLDHLESRHIERHNSGPSSGLGHKNLEPHTSGAAPENSAAFCRAGS